MKTGVSTFLKHEMRKQFMRDALVAVKGNNPQTDLTYHDLEGIEDTFELWFDKFYYVECEKVEEDEDVSNG